MRLILFFCLVFLFSLGFALDFDLNGEGSEESYGKQGASREGNRVIKGSGCRSGYIYFNGRCVSIKNYFLEIRQV